MKQLLKDRLKKMDEKEQEAAQQQQAQQAQAPAKGKPDLKQVG